MMWGGDREAKDSRKCIKGLCEETEVNYDNWQPNRDLNLIPQNTSRGSSVGITSGYGFTTEGSKLEPRSGKDFSFLHVIQTGSGAHSASYPMGTGGSFPRGKMTEA
jgi:hypothetical protein